MKLIILLQLFLVLLLEVFCIIDEKSTDLEYDESGDLNLTGTLPSVEIFNDTAEPLFAITDEVTLSNVEIFNDTAEPLVAITDEVILPSVEIFNDTAEPLVAITDEVTLPSVEIFNDTAEPIVAITDEATLSSGEIFNYTNLIRKCCPSNYFYSTESNACAPVSNDDDFLYYVNELMNYQNWSIVTISKKIDECPGTFQKPSIKEIPYAFSLIILEDGEIYDYDLNTSFSRSHYCLEMVGSSIDSSTLVMAYCLGHQNFIPKCCPKGHYFDTRVPACSPYYNDEDNTEDSSLAKYLHGNTKLSFEKDLICNDMPIKIRLSDTYFNENLLCINKSKQCYNSNEFCIDNMLKDYENELVQSAFVCPYNFINKCCPEGQSLYEHGCKEEPNQSLSLVHILKHSTYQVKSVSNLGSECTPVTLEDNTKSDIEWSIDIHGFAVIQTYNDSILTRNFCIDDYVSENDISPVLKVCSEEVNVYHEISSITDWSDAVVGKCCPGHMYYDAKMNSGNKSQCIDKTDNSLDTLEKYILNKYNISYLVFSNFPSCSITEYYHKYDLQPSYNDYVKITEHRHLNIISKENNCIRKVSQVDASNYCVDFVSTGKHTYKAVAIVCAVSKGYYTERGAIVVSLVGISCAALISAFFSLVIMRVRRGMVTVKKINTLAGRILTSYVLSQLVGYLVLGIGTLADFEEETAKCYVLAGFLMFFTIASFCWNTSICLEGLLLTMHIQVSERRRFVYHCIWSWGTPAIITAAAFIKDSRRNDLPCDAITPKFGVGTCFFSDAVAQLLYFYLPISITVVINAILLASAKILRKNKLKNLEKDPNRIRRHENLQQVLSIKSIKSKIRGEPSIKPVSNHSGLRTHHNRNIWIESIKLVLWSGTTWLMEIIGTLVTMYGGISQGEWYNYLWYFPVGFNCLRGLGIFAIISFNSENKMHILRTARTLRISVSTTLSKFVPSLQFVTNTERSESGLTKKKNNKSIKGNTVKFSSQMNNKSTNKKASKQRSTSVTTVVTNISNSVQCGISGGGSLERSSLKSPTYSYSISQDDSRSTNNPNQYDLFNYFEENFNADKLKEEEEASLDNTSMENVFWENELQMRRNDGDFEKQITNYNNEMDSFRVEASTASKILTDVDSKCNEKSTEVKHRYFFEDYDYCTHL